MPVPIVSIILYTGDVSLHSFISTIKVCRIDSKAMQSFTVHHTRMSSDILTIVRYGGFNFLWLLFAGTNGLKCYKCGGGGEDEKSCEDFASSLLKSSFEVECYSTDKALGGILGSLNPTTEICQKTVINGTFPFQFN